MYASSIKCSNYSSQSSMSPSTWILNYGTSHHMSYDDKAFVSLNPFSCMPVMTVDGTHMPLVGIGSVSTTNISLFYFYYILSLTLSLPSISQLCDSSYSITFSST